MTPTPNVGNNVYVLYVSITYEGTFIYINIFNVETVNSTVI